MGDKVALDTNILVYAIDPSDRVKHRVAATVVVEAARRRSPLTLQALNELAHTILRKRLMPQTTLTELLEFHRESFAVQAPSFEDLLSATQAHYDHSLPLWDALLWATARRAGCTVLLSEDFQDGRILGGVRFMNPFKLSRRELQVLWDG